MIDVDSHHYLPLPPQTISVPKSLRLPLYLRIIFIVLTDNVILVIVWLALVRSPVLPQNPFTSFDAIFLGQPWRMALARDFLCLDIVITSSAGVSQECLYQPETGPFSQMRVIVLDGIIAQLSFVTREDAVRVGDLAQLWGRPNRKWIHIYDWPEHRVTVFAPSDNGRFEYFLRVYYITFTL